MHTKGPVTAVALLFFAGFVIFGTSPALAASAACQDTYPYTNVHDGVDVSPHNSSYMDKAVADITMRTSNLCTAVNGFPNFTATYSMLHDSADGHAQIGF